jgi:hypothetical protein
MADSAALLVDQVLPHQPMRQWVLSVPFPLRFLFASQPAVMGKVLGIIYRTIATHLTHKAGFTKPLARTPGDTPYKLKRAAKSLGVHPNTIYVRLQKIEDLTGLNPLEFHPLSELLFGIELFGEGVRWAHAYGGDRSRAEARCPFSNAPSVQPGSPSTVHGICCPKIARSYTAAARS